MQVLIHSKLFLENFLDKSQIIKKSKNNTSYYFYNILYNIHKNKNLKVIDIREYINFFKNIHLIFGGIKQCDTSEFLRVLLEDISTELNEINNIKSHIILENDHDKKKILLPEEYRKTSCEKESSITVFHSAIRPP